MLQELPIEIVACIVEQLPSTSLLHCSTACTRLRELVRLELRARLRRYFGRGGRFKYIFEIHEPSESIAGQLLEYSDRELDPPRFGLRRSTFTFQHRPEPWLYQVALEPDTFTQLAVVGTILEPRTNGRRGLEAILPHIDSHFRLKRGSLGVEGSTSSHTVAERVRLKMKLLRRHDRGDASGTMHVAQLESVTLDGLDVLELVERHIEVSQRAPSLIFRGVISPDAPRMPVV